jgi:NhaP-type Na+/H+ or K+/H+ antiporter
MEPYVALLTGFGALVLLTAWLPMLIKEAPLSLPILCVGFGAALFAIPAVPGPAPAPQEHLHVVERLTELVVIISLMSAGLKIDRRIGWKSWMLTWRLLGFAMPLAIFAFFLMGQWLLGLGAASALLLAAVLAPTDPVLASDIQVGRPGEGEEDEARFALTSEAGLNDSLAFPFANAAIGLALLAASSNPESGFWAAAGEWLAIDVVWKIGFGLAAGYGIGRALGWLLFHLPNRAKISRTGDGFVALGVTCLAYGLTEIGHGYGFLAVIVAALAIRSAERGHAFHQRLHDFAEELERVLMMTLLVAFGGALTRGDLLGALTWEAAGFALLAIFVIRPVTSWLSLAGTGVPAAERGIISFYGIRGMGSVYYLAYAVQKAEFEQTELLWSTLAFIILISILLHGATVTPVMARLGLASQETVKGEADESGGERKKNETEASPAAAPKAAAPEADPARP